LHDPTPPRKNWALTPEAFDLLLSWLHPDREQAGLKYEEIRAKLIKRCRHFGCHEPEELANQTMDRVARKLPEVIDTYKGEPEPYFYSVAYYVYKEYLRKPIMQSLATLSFREPSTTDLEEMSENELLDSCLKHCLDQMDAESRDMVLEYYRGRRQVKIQARKALAERMGISLAALRLRTQRARSTLKKCILECMERKARERH
jgi:DNA-directed RNA polymerase specialized sigma24 family protein